MGFFVTFFISLAIDVVGELLRPKQKFDKPKPSALGDFSFPTADSTRIIPVFRGTCKVDGPNTTWFGDLKAVAIKKKVKTGWFSSTTMIQGYQYFLGVQLVYGYGPMDEVIDFRIDNKTVLPYPLGAAGTGDVWSFTMDKPTLLGNDDPPNGVGGPVKIYKGTRTQVGNAYLQTQWTDPQVSCFRPLIYAVMEHCYLGNSDTPPPITLVGRCTPNPIGLTGGKQNINGDYNPACFIYEIYTDLIFGLKIPPEKFDLASFVSCGEKLYDEVMGVSMLIDTATKGRDLIADILRHVDGVVYADPSTKLYTMKLVRNDYDVSTIPVFDKSNIDAKTFEFSRISWEDTINATIVNYIDRGKDFLNTPVAYRDLANVFVRRGEIDSETIDFLGFSNSTVALKAAARANKTRSSPIARCAFNTDRSGYILRPASVILVRMPKFGVESLVARVIDINYGTLDDQAVKIVTTEDIFDVNALAYLAPDGGDFVAPGGPPVALHAQRLMEAPHYGAGDEQEYVMTMGVRDSDFDLAYEVWSDPTGGTTYTKTNETTDFTPSGLLTADYLANGDEIDAVGFTIGSTTDMSQVNRGSDTDRENGLNLVVIGDEILAWKDMVDNGDHTFTFSAVFRGVLDTVPQDHHTADRVYFISEGASITTPDGYTGTVTVQAKLLTKNPKGTLALAGATATSTTTNTRSVRPLVPGRVRINTTRPADLGGTVTGVFDLTWAHRNRDDSLIRSQSENSVTPEANTLYNVRFYDAGMTLIIEKTDISSTVATVGLVYTGNVTMQLEATRDGIVSYQMQTAVFAYAQGSVTVSAIAADATDYILDGGAP